MTDYLYLIADWQVRLRFANDDDVTGMHLLPSFAPFSLPAAEADEGNQLFIMTIDQQLQPDTAEELQPVKVCDTGNGEIAVARRKKGGYQFEIHDLRGDLCALMLTDADFTNCHCRVTGHSAACNSFGLNNALMMAFAFAGATRGTLMIHASLVRHNGIGYAFVAKSGTGKSTQTANWLKMIPGCDLMNDDNPVVRVKEDECQIYGSPWSGKTPCYRQVKAKLGAVTRIVRDSDNHVVRTAPLAGFSDLLSSCSVMPWDKETYSGICDSVTTVIEKTPTYHLHCTADPASALVCYEAIGSIS